MIGIYILITVLLNALTAGLFFYILKKDGYKIHDTETELTVSKAAVIYCAVAVVINIGFALFIYFRGIRDIEYLSRTIGLTSVLWPVAFIDLKTYRIPNKLVVCGLGIRGAVLIYEIITLKKAALSVFVSDFIAAAIIVGVSFLCTMIIKNSIGFGDIKIFAVLGLFLGISGIFSAVFFSLVVSFVIACYVLITKKKGRKDTIPFGPAIVLGTYLSLFLSIY